MHKVLLSHPSLPGKPALSSKQPNGARLAFGGRSWFAYFQVVTLESDFSSAEDFLTGMLSGGRRSQSLVTGLLTGSLSRSVCVAVTARLGVGGQGGGEALSGSSSGGEQGKDGAPPRMAWTLCSQRPPLQHALARDTRSDQGTHRTRECLRPFLGP